MTTNPDGDGKREEACETCKGDGCPDCSGTGLAPQFLVQHPDFKREQ